MQPYVPQSLPLTGLDYRRLLTVVGQANAALALYDGMLRGIPNPEVMLSPLTTQEAVLSSKIEGTQVTVDEVLEHEAGLFKEGEKSKDIQEISNYRTALFLAREYLAEYPIRLSFVRQLHSVLMASVRGEDNAPGEFRLDQNWIGRPGSTIQEAIFVPPNPLQLPEYLTAWERYVDGDDVDPLLQAAVMHAQFELLHPFKDGNGRIGRILIPLFLYQKNVLSQPMFYLSDYLENHRDEYYARLKAISAENDWDGWIVFFLQAVIRQAGQNIQRVEAIQELYEEMKGVIQEATRSPHTVHMLDAIFSKPVFPASDLTQQVADNLEIHGRTVSSWLRRLKEAGILRELQPSSGRRSAILCFPRLVNVAEGQEIFGP